MAQFPARNVMSADEAALVSSASLYNHAKGALIRVAAWITGHEVSFRVISIGMIVMLLWAGSFKMTALGAEAITPLVTHSPLVSWHFKVFGPRIGSGIIGLTEITAALLLIVGYFRATAGILGGMITTLMFFITSTMLITTPGAIITIHGMRYMSFVGLFLFKDVISFGVSFYLIGYFGKRAILSESKR